MTPEVKQSVELRVEQLVQQLVKQGYPPLLKQTHIEKITGQSASKLEQDRLKGISIPFVYLGRSIRYPGFDFHRVKTLRGKWGVHITPRMKARTALLTKLKEIFRRFLSQPVDRVIVLINPILRGWVNYFRVGHSSRCLGYGIS